MSVLVLGGLGNMGRRYRAILDHLEVESEALDRGCTESQIKQAMTRAKGVIIATPTETHARLIQFLSEFRKPILCEKPVCKDLLGMAEAMKRVKADMTPFAMVHQYKVLADPGRIGWTHYNYFKHGTDGLYWDCIQIIGLGRGQIELEETSPIWRCQINSQSLDIGSMDYAYIRFIRDWMREPKQDLGYLMAIHEKTAAMERECAHVPT